MDSQPTGTPTEPQSPTPSFSPASGAPDQYSGLPSPRPDMPIQPVAPVSARRRPKWLLMLALPLLLLSGGGVAAYYGYYVPKQTNSKVLNALYALLEDNTYSSFNFSAEVTTADTSVPSFAIDLTSSSDGAGNTRADLEFTYSALRLSGSAIGRTEDKSIYLKINELPSLLSLADGYTGGGLSAIGEKIGNKWVKIDTSSLSDSGLFPTTGSGGVDACVAAYQNLLGKDKQVFLDQIAKLYEQHSFLNAKKVGSEDVAGQSATKYSLSISNQKLVDFVTSEQIDLSHLESACGLEGQMTTEADKQNLKSELDKLTVSNTFVWLNDAGKVAKLATDMQADATKVSANITFGSEKLDTTAPTDVITVDELLLDYQTLLLNSSLQTSTDQQLTDDNFGDPEAF